MITRCENCQGPLPILARAHARFCSSRCRTAACRARNPIPAELRSRGRWVRHSASKMPLQTTGRAASSTDPETWTTHAKAKASAVGAGAGFVLNGDGIACIDLDHCIAAGGSLAPWAAAILAEFPATYTEVSPSGTGLHVWCRATVGRGRKIRRADGACVEIYDRGRYVTVTGNTWGDAPSRLADAESVLAACSWSRA